MANGFLMEMVRLLQRTQQQAKFDAGFVGCFYVHVQDQDLETHVGSARKSRSLFEGDLRAVQGLSAV